MTFINIKTSKEIDPHLPINKTARRLITKPLHDTLNEYKSSGISSILPLPFIEVTKDTLYAHVRIHSSLGINTLKNEYSAINAKFGKLTVLGLSATFLNYTNKNSFNKKGRKWVVRCACGKYEIRTTIAINNPKNNKDCCIDCRKINSIRRKNKTP